MSVLRDLKLGFERVLESEAIERLLRPVYPPFAVELSARRLVSVALDTRGSQPALVASRVIELEPETLRPSLLRPGVLDLDGFRDALRRAVLELPDFDGKLSLAVPDQTAKVTLLEVPDTATTSAALSEVIRWKLKRATPFRIEEARIAHQVVRSAGEEQCLATLAQDAVIDQLETLTAELGIEVGLIDLASFHLWNLVSDRLEEAEDVLLLNVTEACATALVARRGEPLFVRCKAPAASGGPIYREILKELTPTLLYYQDHVGGPGIRAAVVRAPEEVAGELRELLTGEHGIPTERLQAVATPVEGVDPDELPLLAPALGAALGR